MKKENIASFLLSAFGVLYIACFCGSILLILIALSGRMEQQLPPIDRKRETKAQEPPNINYDWTRSGSGVARQIIEIDGCEYLESYQGINSYAAVYCLTHKGNCKNPVHHLNQSIPAEHPQEK